MGDISSGMSSSIMQIYLKQVLESFFHTQSTVRHFALSVITLTLSQGLIHPVQVCSQSRSSVFSNKNSSFLAFLFWQKRVIYRWETFLFQCVPYLIAMGTDPEPAMKNKADQQLVEIDKKYSGFIHVSGSLVHDQCVQRIGFSSTVTANRNVYVAFHWSIILLTFSLLMFLRWRL